MKYNKYEIAILLGLIFFTVENVLFWIIGLACLVVGACYIVSHEEGYMEGYSCEEDEEDEYITDKSKEQYIA